MKKHLLFVALFAAAIVACAKEEEADPVPVDVAIQFPSTPAAVVVDSVRIFVYEGTQDCAQLVSTRRTRPAELPPAKAEKQTTPCEMITGAPVQLSRNVPYTVLVAGSVGDKDLLVGCAQQNAFGTVQALPVDLTYAAPDFTLTTIEATAPGSTTKCAKLGDKCGGRC